MSPLKEQERTKNASDVKDVESDLRVVTETAMN